jgi:hypothetical protein
MQTGEEFSASSNGNSMGEVLLDSNPFRRDRSYFKM